MGDAAYAAEELAVGLDWMGEMAPGAASSFRALIALTVGEGWEAPSVKARALLNLALAVAARCDCCVERQTRAAAKAGANRDDVIAALQRGVMIADGAAMAVGAEALALFDRLMGEPPAENASPAFERRLSRAEVGRDARARSWGGRVAKADDEMDHVFGVPAGSLAAQF